LAGWRELGGRLAVALGLLALGVYLAASGERAEPVAAKAGGGVFEVSGEIAARFQDTVSGVVWVAEKPLDVVEGWGEAAADGEEAWAEGEEVEWPVRRGRPIYARWEAAGADFILATPADARRFQYTIDPTFGVQDRLPTIKGMMIRFRLDF
jgi:hypothetical protein